MISTTFDCIGLPLRSNDDFGEFLRKNIRFDSMQDHGDGWRSTLWVDPSGTGAGIALQTVDIDASSVPCVVRGATSRIGMLRPHPTRREGLLGSILSTEDEPVARFVAELAEWPSLRGAHSDDPRDAVLSVMANVVRTYPDAGALAASPDAEIGARSFVPVGTLGSADLTSRVIVTGTVVRAKQLRSFAGGGSFALATILTTAEVPLSVAWPAELTTELPAEGSALYAEGQLACTIPSLRQQ